MRLHGGVAGLLVEAALHDLELDLVGLHVIAGRARVRLELSDPPGAQYQRSSSMEQPGPGLPSCQPAEDSDTALSWSASASSVPRRRGERELLRLVENDCERLGRAGS